MVRTLTVLAALVMCAACTEPTVPPTPTAPPPTPSPTPEPKTLTICMPNEPDSLYLYGTDSLASHHVWQAIYDGPLDSRGYGYQPVILTNLPGLDNGNAAVEAVTVQAGDRVLAANGEVTELAPGVTVADDAGQAQTFDGSPLLMPQMIVTFTLQSDLYWSDGIVLTADDSVFSFELAADPATPTDKHVVERTADYRAADNRTVVWRGIPGFMDRAFFLNFWHPLPRHLWGHLSAAALLSADTSTRQPLGWGPFVLREWVPGDHIELVRNRIYFREPEGLPRVDELVFRFVPDPSVLEQELLAGRCDVAVHDPDGGGRGNPAPTGSAESPPPPTDDPDGEEIEAFSSYDARWEALAFGISPGPGYDRPDFFENVQVRQAIALCIDRQAVADQVMGPSGRVLHSFLPPEHPLYAGDALTTWGYAPAAGQTLLAGAGWYDEDGDGVREAHGIAGIAEGTPFRATYHTSDEPERVQTAQLVQGYLAECGIQVTVEVLPDALFAPGPEGVLFGRRFDLAQFSWRATFDPLCDLFLSEQIPDTGRWDRPNVAGFLDDAYDDACLSALEALPGDERYATGHVEAQRIFSERLPVLPLFQHTKTTLARASVIGLAPDPTQASELWNVELLDVQP